MERLSIRAAKANPQGYRAALSHEHEMFWMPYAAPNDDRIRHAAPLLPLPAAVQPSYLPCTPHVAFG
jgi:hypothetical protein